MLIRRCGGSMVGGRGSTAKFRQRKEHEKSIAATYFVVVAVIIVTMPLLWASFEFLFYPYNAEIGTGRCLVMKISSARHTGYYVELILLILSFGSSLIAKRVEIIHRWRVLVYGSALGIVCCMLIITMVQPKTQTLLRASEVICDVPRVGDMLPQITSDFRWYCGALIIWYCGLIATQFGLELPKRNEPETAQ